MKDKEVQIRPLASGGFSIFVGGVSRARFVDPETMAAHFAGLLLTLDEFNQRQREENFAQRKMIEILELNDFASWDTICRETQKIKAK